MTKKSSNIISISKGANFYYAKANNYYLKNNINKALEYYKRAMVIEPENSINHFNVASLLAEMGDYTESNKILRRIIKMDPNLSDSWFYMGINYGQLQKYRKVKYCLEKYLSLNPDGEHSEQSKDILLALKSSEHDWEAKDYGEIQQIQEICTKGIELVEKGEYSRAEEIFKQAMKINKKVTAPINNLALTYYYQGKIEEAVVESKRALAIDETNIHAICNIINFYQELKDEINTRYMVKSLQTIDIENLTSEEMVKLAVTYGSLGKDSMAFNILSNVLQHEPNSFKVIFFLGIASFNKRKFSLSQSKWKKLNEIEPGNPFSAYFMNHIDKVLKLEEEFSPLNYQIKVPYNSLVEIVKLISESDLSDEEINKYREDECLFDSIVWALNKGDNTLKEPIIDLMISLNDGKYIGAVVDFCYDLKQSYNHRNHAFKSLLKESYSFSEPELWKVDIYDNQNNWTNPQRTVLSIAIQALENKGELKQVYMAQTLWNQYVTKTKPIIRNIESWALALVGFVTTELGTNDDGRDSKTDKRPIEKSVKQKIRKIKDVVYNKFQENNLFTFQ